MPTRARYTRLILRCYICLPTVGQLIEPSCEDVVIAACDHALDEHRDHVADHGDAFKDLITVVS